MVDIPLGARARAYIVKTVNPLDIPSALRQAHYETVYHAIGGKLEPDGVLRAAGLTAREITMLKALARGLSKPGDERGAVGHRADSQVPTRQPPPQARRVEPDGGRLVRPTHGVAA